MLSVVMRSHIKHDNFLKLVFIIRPYYGVMLRVLHAKSHYMRLWVMYFIIYIILLNFRKRHY